MSKLPETVNILFTQAQRKVIADFLPTLANRLKLDEKNSRTISFTTKELDSTRQKAETALFRAETGMVRNSLRHVVDAIAKVLEDSEGIGSIPASERLYQFKITLLESKPPIWRRIQVKNGTLDKLHEHIQSLLRSPHRIRIELNSVTMQLSISSPSSNRGSNGKSRSSRSEER